MSLNSMRRKMSNTKSLHVVVWVVIVVFVLGIIAMVLPNLGKSLGGSNTISSDMPSNKMGNIIATVNGDAITDAQLDWLFSELSKDASVTLSTAINYRQNAFEQIAQDVVFSQVKKDLGIKIFSWDKKKAIRSEAISVLSMIEQYSIQTLENETAAAGKQTDESEPASKPRTLDAIRKDYMNMYFGSNEFFANIDLTDREAVINAYIKATNAQIKENGSNQIDFMTGMMKVGHKIGDKFDVSPFTANFAKNFNTKEVKASWIFIAAQENTESSLAEAQKKAEEIRKAAIEDPKKFSELAKENSNDFMTTYGDTPGSLGWLNNSNENNVSPMAIYMAFAYGKGDITPSMLVASNSYFGPQTGYGFVYIEDIRDNANAPKNWDEVKADKEIETAFNFSTLIGSNYVAYKRNIAKIERLTPELQYYDVVYSDPTKASELLKTIAYDSALPGILGPAFKAILLKQLPEDEIDERINLLTSITSAATGAESANFYIELGQLFLIKYEDGKENGEREMVAMYLEDAKKQFGYALSTAVSVDSDQSIHKQLRTIFSELGDKERVAEIDEWLKQDTENKEASAAVESSQQGTVQLP